MSAARVDLYEGTLRPDHVRMCLKAPKFSMAFVIDFLKGKSAVWSGIEGLFVRPLWGAT